MTFRGNNSVGKLHIESDQLLMKRSNNNYGKCGTKIKINVTCFFC